ncbi:MAG: type VI secretion system-associated FHA domain protein TagH [Woeseia sp.]
MPLQLKIVSFHKDLMGDDATREFRTNGGTIGRGLRNDWILPDTERFISSRHATIDFQSGSYYLADISTNGVFVNDEEEPLGKGNPRRLFSGDRLRMGEFEFEVQVDEGEGLEMPAQSGSRAFSGDLELLVPEEPIKTGIQLLDEEEITGGDAFQSALFGTTKMDHTIKAEETANRKRAAAKAANESGLQKKPIATGDDNEALLQTFLTAAGIDRSELHPSVDAHEVMQNAGEVLHEFVAGISEMLASRANLKSMFRLDQTTVLPRHNNPLKVSANTTDSMKQLLVGRPGEYLGPLDSVREVCRDLNFHQDAMLGAMITAFRDFADRLDPEELQESFDRNLPRKPLFNSFAKLKYWQLYCDLYPVMTQTGNGPLPHQVGEEFVRSYERHLAEFKRSERGDGKAA